MDWSNVCLKLLKWIILKFAHFTPITLGKVRPRTLYKSYEWNNFKLINSLQPITLGKFVLSSSCSKFVLSSSYLIIVVVHRFVLRPQTLKSAHFVFFLLSSVAFWIFLLFFFSLFWCFVFNLNHWSEEWPVFLSTFLSPFSSFII